MLDKKKIFMELLVSERIKALCPELRIGSVWAEVVNCATPDALWQELEDAARQITERYELLQINARPAVAATRRLYKALGKDPGRYRVASEALCRRIIRGLGIYRLTSVVDVINLVSIVSGYPISGLDADKIVGNVLTLGVGEVGEGYCGIGRGPLNIAGMPVYRDAKGGVATPTSDEERTQITLGTTHVQININAFGEEMPLADTVAWTVALLEKYCSARNITTSIISL